VSIFLSTIIGAIDDKQRVVVPKEFRLSLGDFDGFVAFISPVVKALHCCTMSRMQKLSDKMDEEIDPFFVDHDKIDSLFATSILVRLDKTGRAKLPYMMIVYAGLIRDVAFVGRGATFQLWNPDVLFKHQEDAGKAINAQ
jgi:MraZ protein